MTSISRRDVLRAGLAVTAGSWVSGSAMAMARGAQAEALRAAAAADEGPRQRLLMDFGWKFTFGNLWDPAKDLGLGMGQGDFAKAGSFKFCDLTFDDSKWRELNLPHDWAVELPFVDDKRLEGHGFKPLGRAYPETSVGWYRKVFELADADKGRRIAVEFDGAFRGALVFFNGYFMGRNDNGYCPFTFDVTDYANYGQKNVLVVRMDASFGDGWFYEGAGIYRHVWLSKTAAVHVGRWESYVRSEVKGGGAELSLGTVVKNQGRAAGAPVKALVKWTIFDAEGRSVATAAAPGQTIAADGEATYTATARLEKPALWSPETPVLYKAMVTVEVGGAVVDQEQVSFGVRTVRFDVNKGFFLNGQAVKLKGTCNHQDHAGVGAALPDRLQWYRLAVLKEMGSNAVRTSHNMPTPEWVEACDRMGMMMMCETRLAASTAEGLAQYEVMVKRYRNSPAIVIWSIGNEEGRLQSAAEGERVAATMVARSHELDPTRLCTEAVNSSWGKGLSPALDVEGFNYALKEIDGYHAAHPAQPMVGTETASTVATRGVYTTDTLRNWVSAYDLNYPPWAETAEQWWKFYGTREYLAGGFAWTGFDYRGEPTPYGWPSISSQFGIVDMCGFPKDDYFYYKAWWGKEPVLHLFPHWNWEQRLGEPVSVWVHTNLEEVELFLNGKSLGKKKVEALTHVEWSVGYEPGTLEARGSRGGKVVMTEKRETTGPVAALRVTADRAEIDADGEDVAVLKVEGVDAQGRVVPTAGDFVRFRVTGEGSVIGVGNGDPNCQEPDKEPARSLFNGLAQLIVQGTKQAGEMVVEAHTQGRLPAVSVTVRTRKVAARACV